MFQRVFESPDLGETEIVRGLLLTAGYHSFEVRTGDHIWQQGADHAFYVEVPEAEIDGVREFLAESGFKAQLL